MKITMTQLSGCLKRPQLTVMVMYSPIHMNKLYSKEEFKKLKGIDPVHSPNYKTQESKIKKNSKKKAHIDKKNIDRINNNLKYGFQIIKGLGRNHNKRKYSRFS